MGFGDILLIRIAFRETSAQFDEKTELTHSIDDLINASLLPTLDSANKNMPSTLTEADASAEDAEKSEETNITPPTKSNVRRGTKRPFESPVPDIIATKCSAKNLSMTACTSTQSSSITVPQALASIHPTMRSTTMSHTSYNDLDDDLGCWGKKNVNFFLCFLN